MQLTPSDLITYYRPSKCELRVFLRVKGMEEAPPSPYEETLRRLGEKHEKNHLATLEHVIDLSGIGVEERKARTLEQIRRRSPVIYQSSFEAQTRLNGVQCTIIGQPDFLILQDDSYLIRDSKISRRITEKDHPEIIYQLNLYGWLFAQNTGKAPLRLEVHNGVGDLVIVEYDGGRAALASLQEILQYKTAADSFYTPVGWSKCSGCPFYHRCWGKALETRDVAIIPEVDQGLARALHQEGITCIDDLLKRHDTDSLSQFPRPWGKGFQKVGKRAEKIILGGTALQTEDEILREPPEIPAHQNYVMFDLEGIPPQFDELEKIYLWGTQVFGESMGDYHGALAEFGAGGDQVGWGLFLKRASAIFAEFGDIPFVHWHIYERTYLDKYVERYGDTDGVAARVRANLFDLHAATTRSLVLPLPSYSLKVVEGYVGFKRTLEEGKGDWAMAKFVEATETEDERLRSEIMAQILTYNKEDLEATWAVFQWLASKRS